MTCSPWGRWKAAGWGHSIENGANQLLQCHGLREQSSHCLLHGFTPLEVQREILLIFRQQFGGGPQKFPSLCDPLRMLHLVLNTCGSLMCRQGPAGMAGGSMEKAETPPKTEALCARPPPTDFFLPSSHSSAVAAVLVWQDALSEVISLHSRMRKPSKAGLGGLPAVQPWGAARASPVCVPLNWGPGRALLLCLQPPLCFFAF